MATLTPTGSASATVNATDFRIGDRVQSLVDGRSGIIVTPDNIVPRLVQEPTPHIEMLPAPFFTFAPAGYPVNSPTDNVKVKWQDGTSSTVPIGTLGKW